MSLFAKALSEEVSELKKNNIQLKFVGDLSRFSDPLQKQMAWAEAETASPAGGQSRLHLQLALNYGGRADITQAVRAVAREVSAGRMQPGDITEADIAANLYGAGMPDPDLFIRTGGESRISNFLLWGVAYAELYFSDTLWPDFDAAAFDGALQWFTSRQRRFGKTGEQVSE